MTAAKKKEEDGSAPLTPVPDLSGPKVTMAAGWLIGTAVALLGGSVLLAVWLSPVAGLAAAQAARSWRKETHPPFAAAAGAAAGVTVAFCGFGIASGLVVGIGACVAAAGWAVTQKGDPARTVICAAVPVMAAASPVLLRATDGLVAALILMSYALVYDAGSWTIGSGARFAVTGPIAGVACIATVTLGIAGVFPQFKGSSAWELGVLAAVVTPLGPIAATLFLGNRRYRAPALRRLDSLLILGPVWALAATGMGI